MNRYEPDGVPQSKDWGNCHSLYWNWMAHRFYPLLFGVFYSVRMDRTHSIRFADLEKKQIESGYKSPSTSIHFALVVGYQQYSKRLLSAVASTLVDILPPSNLTGILTSR